MTKYGVDYAWERPDVNALRAAGKTFAVRYIGLGTSDKWLTRTEAEALNRAGLSIVLNCEGTTNWMLGGYSAGMYAAQRCVAAMDAMGIQSSVPVYYSADFDVTAERWSAVLDCLRGATQVHGWQRTGIYGGTHALQWAQRDSAARWFWQAAGWRYGEWVPFAHIRQYQLDVPLAGARVDYDVALQADFGEFMLPGIGREPTVDAREALFALADGSNTDGYLAGIDPALWEHLQGRTLTDIVGKLDHLKDVPSDLVDFDAAIGHLADQVQALRDQPAPVVEADAITAAILPKLREIVEDAVARVLRTARNPTDDDEATEGQ